MAVAPNFPVCQPLSDLEVCNGGYDDQLFLDPAPESLQCPVCLLVLRDPHLLSCCGAHICQVEIMYNYDIYTHDSSIMHQLKYVGIIIIMFTLDMFIHCYNSN